MGIFSRKDYTKLENTPLTSAPVLSKPEVPVVNEDQSTALLIEIADHVKKLNDYILFKLKELE